MARQWGDKIVRTVFAFHAGESRVVDEHRLFVEDLLDGVRGGFVEMDLSRQVQSFQERVQFDVLLHLQRETVACFKC